MVLSKDFLQIFITLLTTTLKTRSINDIIVLNNEIKILIKGLEKYYKIEGRWV